MLHVDRPKMHAVTTSIVYELRRSVESHRPAIEQSCGKSGRRMALQPTGGIHQQGKRGAVTLRESVGPKPQDLVIDLFGKFSRIAPLQHSREQFFTVVLQAPLALPRSHGTTHLVRLTSGEPGRHH